MRFGTIDLGIDLPIHSHLDFKVLISSVNSCELLLLPSAPSRQLIDTTRANLYHSNSNHDLKNNFQPPTSPFIIYKSFSNHIYTERQSPYQINTQTIPSNAKVVCQNKQKLQFHPLDGEQAAFD